MTASDSAGVSKQASALSSVRICVLSHSPSSMKTHAFLCGIGDRPNFGGLSRCLISCPTTYVRNPHRSSIVLISSGDE